MGCNWLGVVKEIGVPSAQENDISAFNVQRSSIALTEMMGTGGERVKVVTGDAATTLLTVLGHGLLIRKHARTPEENQRQRQ